MTIVLTAECNYDSGRPSSSFEKLTPTVFSPLQDFYPLYPALGEFINPHSLKIHLTQHIRVINAKYDQALSSYNMLISGNLNLQTPADGPNFQELSSTTSTLYQYKFSVEEIIYHMRRILDTLVQITYLMTNGEEFNADKIIRFDAIGKVKNGENSHPELYSIIHGGNANYTSDNTQFLKVINDVFNSFKHSLIHNESNIVMGAEIPTVVSYYAKNGRYSDITFHNHNLTHIMMGFNDNLVRILNNQKVYLNRNHSA